MKNKFLYLILFILLFVSGCEGFLDRDPSRILTEDQVYSDPGMVTSVLSNLYARVNWGPSVSDDWGYIFTDEAMVSNGGPENTRDYGNFHYSVRDYGLIRNINQFLEGIRNSQVIDAALKKSAEGEARFLRAYTYFYMAKSFGGMPIVGDEVFVYEPGMDITSIQIPRSTEAEIYDYVIKECDEASKLLTNDPTTHAARANKWAALGLKARAALYAASIAKYNAIRTPQIVTPGGEVGIPASKATEYYTIALNTAKEIMEGGVYKLQNTGDKSVNFYNAVTVKGVGNTEVIWAKDYDSESDIGAHGFTTRNIPPSLAEDIDRSIITPILNVVEDFEYTDNRNGAIRTHDALGNYIFYDNPEDAFKNKDPRLAGTVIYPGGFFRSQKVNMQAGILYLEDGKWEKRTGVPGSKVPGTEIIMTDINGPTKGVEEFMNKSGFFFKKFLDETPGSSTRGKGSAVWFPRIRFAEIVMIACEAAYELGNTDEALDYINMVRARAGIPALTSITFQDIVRENRVEFAFENHRWWDLKRWRLAHVVWNGQDGDANAQHWALFPYRVVEPASPMNGKWVYEKIRAVNSPFPRFFQMRNYYNFIDQAWINSNPKLVKNPYQ